MNLALLLAAGHSKRFGCDKLFELLGEKSIFLRSLDFLHDSRAIHEIRIAVNSKNRAKIKKLVKAGKYTKVKKVFIGGKTRFESVKKCLAPYASRLMPHVFFIIHNAANPFATKEELQRCFQALKRDISGAAVGRKVTSTIKKFSGTTQTIPRKNLWEAETPQVVRAKDFIQACQKFPRGDFTDDLAVLEAASKKTVLVSASPWNRKITTRQDCHEHAPSRRSTDRFVPLYWARNDKADYTIGIGEDSHRFRVDGKKNLVLGGITLKNLPALEAQSDGDVMLHAFCNALASALGHGSLGTYATAMRQKGIRSSREYLKHMLKKMRRGHCHIANCSFSFEAKRPAIDPLTSHLKKSLSRLLKIPPQKIGITATSGEALTPFGRGEAMKCQAIVLLKK